MAIYPVSHILTKNKTDKPVPAIGKSHDKGPCSAKLSRLRIFHHPRISKINLALASRRYLNPHRHGGSAPLKLRFKIPDHCTVADPNICPFLKKTPDLLGIYLLVLQKASDPFLMGINTIPNRGFLQNRRIHGCFQLFRKITFPGERGSTGNANHLGESYILTNRVPIKPQGTPNLLQTDTLVPLINHLYNLIHRYLPPSHRYPSLSKLLNLRRIYRR